MRSICLAGLMLCLSAFSADDFKLTGAWEGKLKGEAVELLCDANNLVVINIGGAAIAEDMTLTYKNPFGDKGLAEKIPGLVGTFKDGRKGGWSTGIVVVDSDTIKVAVKKNFTADGVREGFEHVTLKRKKE